MTQGQKYWDLFKDLVQITYATDPNERLGLCEPIIADEFPYLTKRTVEATANTVLRVVAWMCENDTYAANDFRKSPVEDDERDYAAESHSRAQRLGHTHSN